MDLIEAQISEIKNLNLKYYWFFKLNFFILSIVEWASSENLSPTSTELFLHKLWCADSLRAPLCNSKTQNTMAQEDVFKKIVSHCKEYGFVFPSSEIYDGLGAVYDYGQNGVELKNNIKQYWWQYMVLLIINIIWIYCWYSSKIRNAFPTICIIIPIFLSFTIIINQIKFFLFFLTICWHNKSTSNN